MCILPFKHKEVMTFCLPTPITTDLLAFRFKKKNQNKNQSIMNPIQLFSYPCNCISVGKHLQQEWNNKDQIPLLQLHFEKAIFLADASK